MPALAPVLNPAAAFLLLPAFDGAVTVTVAAVRAVEAVETASEGTADHSDGGTAWKVSDVGMPVHPLSPQQCHSCSV